MKSESDTLHISVLHGDLNHTSHPILLSHYEGDTIAGAERIVDKFVGNGLLLSCCPRPMRSKNPWACSMAQSS
jgi:hypothetical protein